jgi:mannose-6-phosphate isomerase class I
MAITLTPFRAMCGFGELDDIHRFVLDLSPELFALGDIPIVQNFVDIPSTEGSFESVMKVDAEKVKVAITDLLRDCDRRLSLNKTRG